MYQIKFLANLKGIGTLNCGTSIESRIFRKKQSWELSYNVTKRRVPMLCLLNSHCPNFGGPHACIMFYNFLCILYSR